MAKKTEQVINEVVETNYDPEEVLAKIVRDDDGDFRLEDCKTGEISDKLKFCDEGDKTIVLVKNSSNRKWANREKADEAIDKDGFFPLYYKASRTIDSSAGRVSIPNKKLIAYLPEDLQAEYNAIIERAIANREAQKKKPMTELERVQAKLKKAQEAYEKLLAQAAQN